MKTHVNDATLIRMICCCLRLQSGKLLNEKRLDSRCKDVLINYDFLNETFTTQVM
jgi:hypothetical protein